MDFLKQSNTTRSTKSMWQDSPFSLFNVIFWFFSQRVFFPILKKEICANLQIGRPVSNHFTLKKYDHAKSHNYDQKAS